MALNESLTVLQGHYINKYSETLWVIMRLGGCILQNQLCRWLYNNETDNVACTRMVKNWNDAKIIRVKKIGSNNLIVLCFNVMQYFEVRRAVKLNGFKIKKSALIMEAMLREKWYEKHPIELKKRMQKASFLAFMTTGEPHLHQIDRYITVFKKRNRDISGLIHQKKIMEQRFDHAFKSKIHENYPPLELNKNEYEIDLYNLECQSSYISGVSFKSQPDGEEKLRIYVDIFAITTKSAKEMSKLIITVQRTIESIFDDYVNNRPCEVIIRIYSHNKSDNTYIDKVYDLLGCESEYVCHTDLLRQKIHFVCFDSKARLFSNIDPDKLV